jgi:SAM-dependent methyltransferase
MQHAAITPRQTLLRRIDGILACPHCRTAFAERKHPVELRCTNCGSAFELRGEQYVFWGIAGEDVAGDWLNRSKERAKRRLKRFYRAAYRLFSPTWGTNLVKPFLKTFDTETQLVADLGSGTREYAQSVVCVDGVGYPSVHVVANLETLPFQNDSLAGVVSVAVLEHAQHPAAQVAEMRRVLAPGGRAMCFVPFIQGFHASPHDYQRYTQPGLRELFRDFEILSVSVGAGPTSGMLWIVQEWIALALSFGSVRLYRLLLPCTWLLLWPLKFLDLLLVHHPNATVIASGHFIEVRKTATAGSEGERGA